MKKREKETSQVSLLYHLSDNAYWPVKHTRASKLRKSLSA
jgi:hypothetical protein